MPSTGATFYDEGSVFEHYTAHRRTGHRSPNHVMEEPAFLRLIGDVDGRRVLDLGCGDAGLGRIVVAGGARSYVGVDASAKMVRAAGEALRGTTGEARVGALETLEEPAGADGLITSRMALHYVEDLDALLVRCARWLAPGGRLVASVVHPVITAHDARSAENRRRTSWQVDDYFDRGPRAQDWMGGSVVWHHRTIADHVAALTRAGFAVEALDEAEPVADRFDGDTDELARRRRIPLFLVLAARLG